MSGESMLPNYDGIIEGDCGYGPDGSLWRWRHKRGEHKHFAVTAEHIPLYGQPLATGLYAEEMSAMLLWLMKDPRCTNLAITALPPAGEWILEAPAPEPVQTEAEAMIADAGHVAIS